MLIRRIAVPAAGALLLALAPPLAQGADAREPTWHSRLFADFREAQRTTRGKGVKIALISDGVAPGVRTLGGALEKGKDLVGTPRPKQEAGTLIASALVGSGPTADAPLGVRGLVSAATLIPVRVYADPTEPGSAKWWDRTNLGEVTAKGIRHAADQGARVIAVEPWVYDDSFRGQVQAAVAHAQRRGALVVAATGKLDEGGGAVPATIPGVLGVGTVTAKGRRDGKETDASTSVLLAAPGTKVISTGPNNRLYRFWGAPAALTWATAAATLVRSEYPRLTPGQVVEALTSSARHPKGKGRYDTDLGHGYVNPAGALKAAREISERPAPAPVPEAVRAKALFGAERPGTIRAVPYDPAILGGFGALALAGLAAVLCAGWLALRRRRAAAPAPTFAGTPAPVAAPAPERPESAGESGS
ncbi:S8 family serine peptidase [Actinomadura viridis]|uniref:S8 family peptidase n=1 Tax=Actinomadura viridis TaxID=58110 RepID=UPI00369A92B3